MTTVQITRISDRDIDILQKLSIDTFKETFAQHNTPDDMEVYISRHLNSGKLICEIQNPLSKFYIAYIDGAAAGYLKINLGNAQTELRDSRSLEVERIYVNKKFQGMRIGESLLNTAINEARHLGLEFVWLGVWEKNVNAIAFYQRYGFAEFDRHPFQLGNDVQTDLMMKLSIA